MSRKTAQKKSAASAVSKSPAVAVVDDAPVATPVAETAVRKTVAPKIAAPAVTKKAPAPLTYERIAERAYYISQSPACRSDFDNWLKAEGELQAESL